MTRGNTFTRRRALAAGAVGVAGAVGAIGVATGGAAVLAGCDDGGCDEWSEEHQPKAGVGPSPRDGRPVLAALADISVGESITARTPEGSPIIISRPTETTAVAFSAECTHHGCLVNPDGKRLHCPPHDGWFGASTGEAEGGPPKKPLRRVGVAVIDGRVVLTS